MKKKHVFNVFYLQIYVFNIYMTETTTEMIPRTGITLRFTYCSLVSEELREAPADLKPVSSKSLSDR